MNSTVFEKTKYFIIDMDGTFYLGGEIIEGADRFIEKALATGRDFRFFTNNSSNNVEVCCEKLKKMGYPVSEDKIIISSHVTIDYLNKNHKAANYIAGGAVYIATHPDFNCPMANGFMPDTGSMIEMFAASTGKRPLVMGKPMTHTVDYITSLLGCQRDEIAFIGDRLATDIAIGADHGIPCALVLTGVTTTQEYETAGIPASVVAESLEALGEYI